MRRRREPEREGPSDEHLRGGPVGNSRARFVRASEESHERAREDVSHPGAIGSQAEPGVGGQARP